MDSEYSVHSLSRLAGVSSRTLRHYDAIGLLRPIGKRKSGYRYYGHAEVERLQRILFFRELDVPLLEIRRTLDAQKYDDLAMLRKHREELVERGRRIGSLVDLIDRTIEEKEGRRPMGDGERFEGFKKELVERNEKEYGEEVRNRYGDRTVDAANRKLLSQDEARAKEAQELGEAVVACFLDAYKTGDPSGPLAREAAPLHRKWLDVYWTDYSKEAHAGLVRTYVEDARFTAYYDRYQAGLTVFLRDAVLSWLGEPEAD